VLLQGKSTRQLQQPTRGRLPPLTVAEEDFNTGECSRAFLVGGHAVAEKTRKSREDQLREGNARTFQGVERKNGQNLVFRVEANKIKSPEGSSKGSNDPA